MPISSAISAFTIYGLAEYHLACGDDQALKIAKGLFRDWKALEDLRLSEKDQNESKKLDIDHKLGEWFWSVDSQGNPQTEKEKAGFWKCPYHNGRACMELIHRIESK